MTQENKIEVSNAANNKTNEKPPLKKRLLGWLGYLALFAALLFFFAPESWWQFGVAPVENRKAAAAFTLKDLNGNEWNFLTIAAKSSSSITGRRGARRAVLRRPDWFRSPRNTKRAAWKRLA